MVYLNWADVEYWAEAAWRFTAPNGTEVDNFSLVRAVSISGDRQYLLYRDFASGGSWPPARTWAEKCISWWDPCVALGSLDTPGTSQNVVERSGLTGTVGLTIALDCQPSSGQVCPAATGYANGYVRMWSSRIGLKDTLDPEFIAPATGSLFAGQPVSEIQYVTFKATDKGGGIKSMGLLVDGVPHGDRLVDPASATCKEPYTKVVPCALSVEPTMVVDTRELANGPHSVRVTVTDVAGNVTQSDPYTVVARNGGQPNGANASRTAKLEAWFKSSRARRTSATVSFRQRRTIEGRLTAPDGQAIAAAVLDVSAKALRPASTTRTIGTVVTDRQGRFRFQPPRGSSREIRVGYRAYTLDDVPAAAATLNLNVRAALSLAVTPKRVRNGSVATFSGRLRGGPGELGTQVTIYAVGGRRGIPVETVPADRRGRFRYRYRFRSISGPTRFSFRAVVKRQPNYPYARGASATVSVRARP